MISRRQLLTLIAATPVAALVPRCLLAGWEPLPSTREWLAKQAVIRLHEALVTRGFTIDMGTEYPSDHYRCRIYECDDVRIFDLDRAVKHLVDKLARCFDNRSLRFFQDPDTTDARIWYRGIHLGADVFKSDQGPEVAIIKVYPVGLV